MSDTEFLAPDDTADLFARRLLGVSQMAWGVRARRMDITDSIRIGKDPVSALSIKIARRSNLISRVPWLAPPLPPLDALILSTH